MIELVVQFILGNNSTVTDLIGDRIYPLTLPQGPTLPAVTFFGAGQRQRDSAMGEDAPFVYERLQVSCWSTNYFEAGQVREACRRAMRRYMGDTETSFIFALGGDGFVFEIDGEVAEANRVTTVTVEDIYVEGAADLFEDDTGLYQRVIDFLVIYRED
ncbi:tail completion protein gp17 [Algiphilus sp.]|uniref:tail completion protein gp17 n=1 Tax=Algiphilus sp. TaxID=1872431 RepID=UPI003CCC302C